MNAMLDSLLSPGIIVIRWMSLAPIRKEAERRARGRAREVQIAEMQ